MRAVLVIGLALFWAACAAQDRQTQCSQDVDCGSGQACYRGFCILAPDVPGGTSSRGNPATGTSNTSISSGKPTTGGSTGGAGGDGSSGSGGKKDAGAGGAGGVIGSPPGGECADGDEQPCLVRPDDQGIVAEACNRGMQQCMNRMWGPCVGQPEPADEICNGLDDDCNNEVDELEVRCFPDDTAGCTLAADGKWSCVGTCETGTRSCGDNGLGDCLTATTPQPETCTEAGALAQDEDCDGKVDEGGCGCVEAACYNGPEGTLRDGAKCAAGMVSCVDGMPGACVGEVTPSPEDCFNQGADDDCDGVVDNIDMLGSPCKVIGKLGLCSDGTKQCAAISAAPVCTPLVVATAEVCDRRDNDCDGRADEDFDLASDSANCGSCGMVCPARSECCSGSCTRTAGDRMNCGACGNVCGRGSACMNGQCVSTMPVAGMPAAGGPSTGGSSGEAGGGTGGSSGVGGATGGMGGGATGGSGDVGGMGGFGGTPGECSPSCSATQRCCAGVCVDTDTDASHCGSCTTECTGTAPACCAGACVDFASDTNCGACGNDCSMLSTDPMAPCTCRKPAVGDYACSGTEMVGVCP